MANRSRAQKKSKVNNKAKLSEQEKAAALAIVEDVSKPGFNKQQRKEVQQAIEQGIERYKRQHKAKARDVDKALKKQKNKPVVEAVNEPGAEKPFYLPWALLALSWLGFAIYFMRVNA